MNRTTRILRQQTFSVKVLSSIRHRPAGGYCVSLALQLIAIIRALAISANAWQFMSKARTYLDELMDHLHYRLNFDLDKNFITAWKSINADNIALRSLPFFSHFVLRTGNWQPNRVLGHQFPVCNTNDWKLQISQGYIIRILQHFSTKLWNITNFVMLFQAVMKFLSRSKFSL
jgi:hypothetical protein